MDYDQWFNSHDERVKKSMSEQDSEKGFKLRQLLITLSAAPYDDFHYLLTDVVKTDYEWVYCTPCPDFCFSLELNDCYSGLNPGIFCTNPALYLNKNGNLLFEAYDECHHLTELIGFGDYLRKVKGREPEVDDLMFFISTNFIEVQHHSMINWFKILFPELEVQNHKSKNLTINELRVIEQLIKQGSTTSLTRLIS